MTCHRSASCLAGSVLAAVLGSVLLTLTPRTRVTPEEVGVEALGR